MEIKRYSPRIQPSLGDATRNTPQIHEQDQRMEAGGLGGVGGRQLAQAAVQYGDRVNEETARSWTSNTLSKARLDWTDRFMDLQTKAGPGAPEFTPNVLKEFDAYAAKTLSAAPTPLSRNYLETRLNDFRSDLGSKSVAFEAQARVDYRGDQYNEAVQNSTHIMMKDPSQYGVVLAERLAELDGAAIPPIKKSELREKAVMQISTAAVYSQMQKSPSSFLTSIGFQPDADGKLRRTSADLTGPTGNSAFDALPFAQRTQMFEGAVRMKAQIDADAENAAKKLGGEGEQEAMKAVYARLYAPGGSTLTRDFVEKMRPLLKVDNYHAALKALVVGPEQRTDPGTLNDIERTIYSDPATAKQMAYTAHRNGNLSNEHLISITTRADSLTKPTQPKSEYERGRAFIVQSMDNGPLIQDPIGKSRMAEALDTFDRWMLSGKRTDQEVMSRSREVVDQYKFIDLRDTVLALPQPRGHTIARQTASQENMLRQIVAVGESMVNKRKTGEWTESEYNAEMMTLNRWRRAAMKWNAK